MKRFLNCAGAGILALTATPVSAQDAADKISGYYCESAVYEMVDISGSCEEPAYISEASGKCITPFVATDYLDISKAGNNNIEFSVMLTFTNGHNCGIENATAHQIEDNVWLYQENIIPGDTSPGANCEIKISYDANGIKLSSENPDATCKDACGFRGRLAGVIFPLATKDQSAEARENRTCSAPTLELDDTLTITK